jgi:ABC-type lipoprotein export system ATPase subunit
MDIITLNSVVPEIFASREKLTSDIWRQEVSFERGKSYLVRAESGTGKSSLCSYLYGQRGDYRGTILFDGMDISRFISEAWSRIRQNQISILFQELRLFGELSAMENVLIKNSIVDFKTKAEIISLFEELGIADKLNSRTEHLSYGQQQRVALIRAICQPFSFLLLDEPISHLDDKNSNIMRDVILREAAKQGAGIIATSIGKHMNIDYDLCLNL